MLPGKRQAADPSARVKMTDPFEGLSEATGIPVSVEGASMMTTRYLVAAEIAVGRRTFELACASGPGLGLLDRGSAVTVGGDINQAMLARARGHYGDRISLIRLSAERLPFTSNGFDFVTFLEASYYVPDLPAALAEIKRVLSPGGKVLLVNANPARPDFIPSPHSHRYHTAFEMSQLLTDLGFLTTTWGAFPVTDGGSVRRRFSRIARNLLTALGLVPKTLKGRARLKKLLGVQSRSVPAEIDESFGTRGRLCELTNANHSSFKVFYVEGKLR